MLFLELTLLPRLHVSMRICEGFRKPTRLSTFIVLQKSNRSKKCCNHTGVNKMDTASRFSLSSLRSSSSSRESEAAFGAADALPPPTVYFEYYTSCAHVPLKSSTCTSILYPLTFLHPVLSYFSKR